jgi:endonuclease/exonuclease/phosphatase family metal-dependent hydrolase
MGKNKFTIRTLFNIYYWPQWIALPFTLFSSIGFYFSPNPISIFSPFSSIFPVFIFWHLIWTLISLLKLKSSAFLGLFIIIFTYPQWKALASFNFSPKEINVPVIKIATWNVHHWKNLNWTELKSTESKMGNWIMDINPDIICFQEDNLSSAASKLVKYRFPYGVTGDDKLLTIVSKFPILQWGSEKYVHSSKGHKEFVWADIQISEPDGSIDTLRIANIHLLTTTFDINNASKEENDIGINKFFIKSFQSLNKNAKKRSQQLDQIIKWETKSSIPVVFAGDFNETPTSNTYLRVTSKKNDSFAKAGRGLGSTFNNLWNIPLRIDWILCPKDMSIISSSTLKQEWSDHNPLIVEIAPF